MKIVIVKKTGVLGELDWKKNVDLVSIYKKCGFRKNKDFGIFITIGDFKFSRCQEGIFDAVQGTDIYLAECVNIGLLTACNNQIGSYLLGTLACLYLYRLRTAAKSKR